MRLFYLPFLFISFAALAQPDNTPASPDLATATFAGGCFWCMEPPFDRIQGVKETISGYSGGETANPTYQQVSSGTTGHYESLRVIYDPAEVSYDQLLEVFWHNIDPTNGNGQFCDTGSQYRSAIFYHNDHQKFLAEQSKNALISSQQLNSIILTPILPVTEFYPAEEKHQNYYQKHPWIYKFYRFTCGRDSRLEELWGDQ